MEVSSKPLVSRSRLVQGGLIVAAIVVSVVGISRLREASNATAQPPVVSIAAASSGGEAVEVIVADRVENLSAAPDLSEKLVGVWHLKKHGERTLTLHADGTAQADVQLNMLGALLYGQELTLKLSWSVEDDVMTQHFESGTPEEAVQRLIRDWGDQREYRVVKLTADELILAELDDENDLDVWTRVRTEPGGASTAAADEEKEQRPR